MYQIRAGRTWKHVVPDETVAAMRAIRQNPWASGRRTVTDEHRERFAGVGRANAGRPVSEANKAGTSARSRGAGNPKARLTEDQAAQILLLSRMALGRRTWRRQYGVSANTILRIRSGETWTHLTGLTDVPKVNGNKGVPKSPEHRAALSAASRKLTAKLTGRPGPRDQGTLAAGASGAALSREFGVSPMVYLRHQARAYLARHRQ